MPHTPAPATTTASSATPALAWTTSAARRIARGSNRRRSARLAWLAPTMPERVRREHHAEELRRGAVDVLEHERRARDVGEHRAEREAAGERVAEEDAVAEQAAERADRLGDAARVPVLGRERLAQAGGRGRDEQRRRSPASRTNTPRHVVTRSTWPPITGARIGARPLTSISSEKKRAAATPECMSRTIARAITIPAAPATPCDEAQHDEREDRSARARTAATRRRRRRRRRAAASGGRSGR